MKRVLLFLALVVLLIGAVALKTKPSDKTCKIVAVKAVWGSVTPDVDTMPEYFEQFMNVTSKEVEVDDWVVLKRVKYHFKDGTKTIGYAAFGKVWA